MFKKTISWLLILALLCSGTVLSIFAVGETAEHDFMWTAADGSTGYGDFNKGSDTEDTSLRSQFGVPAGGTVTLLRNVTLRKRIRLYENPIAVLDGNGFTITGASFDASFDDVAISMTIKNVTFDFTADESKGEFERFIQLASSKQNIIFENCNFDIKGTPKYAVIIPRGDLTLKDCTFKYTTTSAKPVFYNEANNYAKLVNTTFDLSGAPNAMVGLGFGINGTYYTSLSTAMSKANVGDTLTLAADYQSDGTDLMRLFNFKENLTIDGNGHTLSVNSGAWVIRAEKSTTIRNLTVEQKGTGFAIQINEGASVTLENTTLQASNATAAVLRGTLTLNSGSRILATNGFFADQGKSSLIVNRGAEINVSGKLYSTKKDADSMAINGGTFTIGGKLLYRDPTADEFKNSDATLFLPDGGVATKNNSGIRFTTVVDKAWLDEMEAAGAKIVGYGTLIAPKKYVDKAGAFTAEALKDLSFADIENNGWFNAASAAEDGCYFFYGNLIKLQPASITNELSGIGYLVVEVEGLGTFTIYGTQQNGTVSKLAAEIPGKDAAQNEVLEFFRGNAD